MSTVLSTTNLSKDYKNGNKTVHALAALDLSVNKSEFVCIIGPNGCGKSTLLKIIAGIITPTSGSYRVPARSAYLPQQPSLLPWRTVKSNLRLPQEISGKSDKKEESRIDKLLKEFSLNEFANFYPHALSGGMQQKVALLRMALSSPRLMLLDEPFSALDAITRIQLQKWLIDLWQKNRPAVVCVTHDIREAMLLADTIYVMSGRPGNVLEKIEVNLPRKRREDHLRRESARVLEKQLSDLLVGKV